MNFSVSLIKLSLEGLLERIRYIQESIDSRYEELKTERDKYGDSLDCDFVDNYTVTLSIEEKHFEKILRNSAQKIESIAEELECVERAVDNLGRKMVNESFSDSDDDFDFVDPFPE